GIDLGAPRLRRNDAISLDRGLPKVLEPPLAVRPDAGAARVAHGREPPAFVELEHEHAAVAIVGRLLTHRDDGAAVFRPGAAITRHADVLKPLEHLHLPRVLLEWRRDEFTDDGRH